MADHGSMTGVKQVDSQFLATTKGPVDGEVRGKPGEKLAPDEVKVREYAANRTRNTTS